MFEIILVQVKGGSAKRPTSEDTYRLEQVAEYYKASKVVLFTWINKKNCQFSVLKRDRSWEVCKN